MAGTQYHGDRTVAETFAALNENAHSVLVDVRSEAEWVHVGIPQVPGNEDRILFHEWKAFGAEAPHQEFGATLSSIFVKKGLDQNADIYFLCRSGVRSQSAAIVMTALGYRHCLNVVDGFEGPLDAAGHRGFVSGWKAQGLPWVQT
ncbi:MULTISPECIES: rhodanese-like domain-containing protein [Pseudovibrio]|uniref:rhodanese-like domain-containing protein n=1 Tax=Stappiaceae TaxID=2821832 RepID=UPI0023664798|nr:MULTISPECIES: rhodanese-like domain-containing protein [Pseudovibrio]MDD7909601.1 rhodanese-like domain-containing protein [Pseudovibrio exalbescens]MDX5595046.1 rhodanese-like domain-containing protein [Pseudovibrio sp. SPO723]